MLANILGIGDPPPRKQTDNYHPIVFDTNVHNNFFLELFSRTMWLLSKTRKEMKARTAEDFFKVSIARNKNDGLNRMYLLMPSFFYSAFIYYDLYNSIPSFNIIFNIINHGKILIRMSANVISFYD